MQELMLTELSREFLSEWRVHHGTRFRVYKQRQGHAQRVKSRNTDCAVRARQMTALAQRSRPGPPPDPEQSTILPGLSQGQAARRMSSLPEETLNVKGIRLFKQRTLLIKSRNLEVARTRQLCPEGKSYPQPKLVRAKIYGIVDSAEYSMQMVQHLNGLRRWKVVDACVEEAPAQSQSSSLPDIRIRRLDFDGDFMTFRAQSQLVVMDTLDDLGSQRPPVQLLVRSYSYLTC
jgi:hypothetical protein